MHHAIVSLPKAVHQRICSDQVITDLPSALKELLENALDAGATRLDIRFREYGVVSLEVADNGRGIANHDLAGAALRHHTSKLTKFDDLRQLRSFGFRGEALNSLAALSTLSLTTCTAGSATGVSLAFGSDGAVSSRTAVAREIGTSVTVAGLFEPFPVRRKELVRTANSEFRRMLALLQAYALICTAVRFSCTNALAKGGKQTLVQTEGGTGGLHASIAGVFGAKLLGELRSLTASEAGYGISGFISRPRSGGGRRSGDRQYLYVNQRPVDFPKLTRLLNDAFRAATAKSECFPVFVIDVSAPPDTYDINVTPDKRE